MAKMDCEGWWAPGLERKLNDNLHKAFQSRPNYVSMRRSDPKDSAREVLEFRVIVNTAMIENTAEQKRAAPFPYATFVLAAEFTRGSKHPLPAAAQMMIAITNLDGAWAPIHHQFCDKTIPILPDSNDA
jgi:hypothetical protein